MSGLWTTISSRPDCTSLLLMVVVVGLVFLKRGWVTPAGAGLLSCALHQVMLHVGICADPTVAPAVDVVAGSTRSCLA